MGFMCYQLVIDKLSAYLVVTVNVSYISRRIYKKVNIITSQD